MIGTIINVEIRESRARQNYYYLAIEFLDDYETRQWLFIHPGAEYYFKQFCEMTKWGYESFITELIGKIISVSSIKERYMNRMVRNWFIISDWKKYMEEV